MFVFCFCVRILYLDLYLYFDCDLFLYLYLCQSSYLGMNVLLYVVMDMDTLVMKFEKARLGRVFAFASVF